jgi:hypothetical protein
VDALATFAGAMGTPKPAACADRPLSKQEATAAAAALTLTDADSRALLAEVIAFDKKRFALHGQKLKLSDQCSSMTRVAAISLCFPAR